jgi:nicotinamidase/pyrazinamidase
MKTLIIVDVQNDFMTHGSLAVKNAERIVPVINQIFHQFDLVVATQDWHPAHHQSFASNHNKKKPFETIMLRGKEQVLWPDHCVQGTHGAAFFPDLNTQPIAAIFRKGMDPGIDSYSGFYDNDHQTSTGLSGYLHNKGAKELYFCGLCADICVYHTIKDAIAENFKCCLIEDATVPLDKEKFQIIRADLLNEGVRLCNSSQNPSHVF